MSAFCYKKSVDIRVIWVRESHLTKIPSLTLRSSPFIVKHICADYLSMVSDFQL